MKSHRVRYTPGPKAKILLTVSAVLIIAVALFDWNWLRGPLVRYLVSTSGREVRIDNLHVSLDFTLQPTLRLRGVYVENAPWAAKQPMATAAEAAFTFSVKSLWERRPIIARLALTDATVDLERQANGLRNWRLTEPDYRGPGKVRVMTMRAERSKIRFVNAEIDLEIVAEATPTSPVIDESHDDGMLRNKLVIEGKYQGARFAGAGFVGTVLSFRESGLTFPLRGYLTTGKTRVEVDGVFADIFDPGPMSAQVRLAGPTLSHLYPFIAFRPPASRPYNLEARVTHSDQKYTFAKLHGRIGGTDLAGEAAYDRSPDPPFVTATLGSASADLADIAFLAGTDYITGERQTQTARVAKARSNGNEQDDAESQRARSERIFSDRALRTERLRLVNGHLNLELKQLRAADFPAAQSLQMTAELADGVLNVKTMNFGVAGGHVVGSLSLDSHAMPPAARANLEGRDIRFEKLISARDAMLMSGAIRSQLKLEGRGKSIAAMLASSTGTLAAIVDGGRISNALDAKLGLSAGKLLGLRILGDRDIALHCGAAAFSFRDGIGKSQTLLLETEQTHIDGVGTINLRDQVFELLLTPQPKKRRLFTLNSSIRVQGSFRNPRHEVDDRIQLGPGGRSVTDATVNALFRPLLVPRRPDSQCAAILDSLADTAKSAVAK